MIPGNDDAIRAGRLMCRVIADAVVEGKFIASRRAADAATRARRATPEPMSAGAGAAAMGEPAAFSAAADVEAVAAEPRGRAGAPPVDRRPGARTGRRARAARRAMRRARSWPAKPRPAATIKQEQAEQDTAALDIEHVTED